MNNLTWLALNGIKVDKDARNAVAPGRYTVDTWVHVKGTVNVSEDTMTPPTTSLPVLEIMALFIARAGFTREYSMELLREVTGEAIAATGKAQGSLAAEVEEVSKYLKTVKDEVIAKLPLRPAKGKVTTKLEVTEEGGSQEAA